MPSSATAGSSAQSAVEPYHSPYRTEASFKQFSAFLNRKITLNSRSPNQFARFSPLDILKQLNVSQAYLKGSSVLRWKEEQAPADIDFQIHCDPGAAGQQVVAKLLDFLDAVSGMPYSGRPELREKHWFNKVVHDLHGSWNRTLLSLGYPSPRSTTIDLNLTNRPHVSYDTIHASKAIYVDWANRKTAVVDCWHPALVDWIQQAGLLWFNPDIDEGLGRLSYRLSKSTDMQLLQPEIASHFFRQASAVSTGNVFMRVLLGEYRNSSLLPEEQAGLWKAVLDVAASGSSRQHQGLQNDMLAWSRFNTVEQLQQALSQPDMQETVIHRLKQGAQVGADFKESLRHILQSDSSFKDRLEPLLGKALGARVMPPGALFPLLDQWEHLQGIPEHELQLVFADYLKYWENLVEPGVHERCRNMLGWLQGDELASLKFWMDRIPDRSQSSPTDRSSGLVVEAAEQLIKARGLEGFILGLPFIENLRLKKDQLYSIIDQVLEQATPPSTTEKAPSRPATGEFFELLATHLPVLLKADVPLATSDILLKDCLSFSRRMHAEKIPSLIRNLVSTRGNMTQVELEDVSLTISNSDECVRLEQGRRQVLLTPHCVVQTGSDKPGGPREVRVNWRDGSRFTGMMQAEKSQACTGKLSAGEQQPVPEALKGLLDVGRRLGLSKWRNLDFGQNQLSAEGQFKSPDLFKSADFTSALRTLKEGEFFDQSPDQFIRICHDIREGLPENCSVTVASARETPSLVVLYKPSRQEASFLPDFQNPWGVMPQTGTVQTQHLQNIAPIGRILLTSLFPWSPQDRMLNGWGEVNGDGDVEFKWKGRFVDGELSPCGRLYLGKSREPAIVFDNEDSGVNMPLSLLPVIAELLGPRLQGSHTFSARVWNEHENWPPAGFEGFINRFESDQYSFSGYITSTGRAVGILGNLRPGDSPFYSAHTGNFRILPPGLFTAPPLSVDAQSRELLGCPVGESGQLVPHGLMQEMMILKADHSPAARIDRTYFCGQGISFNVITQDPELAYRAPNRNAYLVGCGYTDQQRPIHLDMMFNPGDGGEDFVKVKPAGFEQQANFRELYVDAGGTTASWVLVNQEYRMGEIQFPCGFRYSGQVTASPDFYRLQGQGKISLGELSFSGRFQPDSTVSDLQAKNPASRHWLSTYSRPSGETRFKLDELVELMSGGEISYQADLHPHLLVRRLGMMTGQAVVFSRQ